MKFFGGAAAHNGPAFMKMIHEIRQQQTWQAPKSASPLPIILGAVVAFGIGLLGVSGVIRVPAALQAKAIQSSDTARNHLTGASRLGNADAAPLLNVCIPFARLSSGQDVNHAGIYRMLKSASSTSRIAALANIKQKAMDDIQFATVWGQIADCVYRLNGPMLCDPDNRALAVEAASTLVRQLATAERTGKFVGSHNIGPLGLSGDEHVAALRNAYIAKDRVLSGIRAQVVDGRLTANDFGIMVPVEITKVIRETKVSRNACSTRN